MVKVVREAKEPGTADGFLHTAGEGRLAVTARAVAQGKDWLVQVYGGTAHVGAVALAVYCPEGTNGVSASAGVLTAPGHRDDTVAHALARKLCKIWRATVCVAVGIHVDGAMPEEIERLVLNAHAAADAIARRTGTEAGAKVSQGSSGGTGRGPDVPRRRRNA